MSNSSGQKSDGGRGTDNPASNTEQLELIRTEIDQIDAQLTELLVRRFALTETIGKTKLSLGIKIKDESREQEVLEKVARTLWSCNSKSHILSIFRSLIHESVEQQTVSGD